MAGDTAAAVLDATLRFAALERAPSDNAEAAS
jgi:hypothetical protein